MKWGKRMATKLNDMITLVDEAMTLQQSIHKEQKIKVNIFEGVRDTSEGIDLARLQNFLGRPSSLGEAEKKMIQSIKISIFNAVKDLGGVGYKQQSRHRDKLRNQDAYNYDDADNALFKSMHQGLNKVHKSFLSTYKHVEDVPLTKVHELMTDKMLKIYVGGKIKLQNETLLKASKLRTEKINNLKEEKQDRLLQVVDYLNQLGEGEYELSVDSTIKDLQELRQGLQDRGRGSSVDSNDSGLGENRNRTKTEVEDDSHDERTYSDGSLSGRDSTDSFDGFLSARSRRSLAKDVKGKIHPKSDPPKKGVEDNAVNKKVKRNSSSR